MSDDKASIANRVRAEIARRGVSRQWVAEEARISLSTLEKGISGKRPFSFETVAKLEDVLGLELLSFTGEVTEVAPADGSRDPRIAPRELGSYSRDAVAWIENTYITVRPSFSDASALYVYLTHVRWDETHACLGFQETDRLDADYTQSGVVSLPNQTGHLYLVTNKHGQHRLIVLSRPTINEEMFGLLTTLRVGTGSQLTPTATPIAFLPLKEGNLPPLGKVGPDAPEYAAFHAQLKRAVSDQFATLLTPPEVPIGS